MVMKHIHSIQRGILHHPDLLLDYINMWRLTVRSGETRKWVASLPNLVYIMIEVGSRHAYIYFLPFLDCGHKELLQLIFPK